MVDEAPKALPGRLQVADWRGVVMGLEDSCPLLLCQSLQLLFGRPPCVLEEVEGVPREVRGDIYVQPDDVPPFDGGYVPEAVLDGTQSPSASLRR